MGWTCYTKPNDVMGELRRQWTFERNDTTFRVLRDALVGLTWYAAVEKKDADGNVEVFAAVTLVRYHRRPYYDTEMCVKEMDESVGPNEARCPKTILALLTPTTHPYAIEWRARCKINAEIKAKKLTDEEISAWAATRGVTFNPYISNRGAWANAAKRSMYR